MLQGLRKLGPERDGREGGDVCVSVMKERMRVVKREEDIRISHDIRSIMAWELFCSLRRYWNRCYYGINGNIIGIDP